ncbi:hypothetical protein O181_066783 [Austropuccinia psidii MF-1]|uniref:Uncharacterized protein n=1 Tax=Austropuccinia psidii MF-1 TaxID=1389203 RepID=A0A9Q3EXQ4_9BASI|nr:hypothetical protein [Austropuccinia psidii MF-1]
MPKYHFFAVAFAFFHISRVLTQSTQTCGLSYSVETREAVRIHVHCQTLQNSSYICLSNTCQAGNGSEFAGSCDDCSLLKCRNLNHQLKLQPIVFYRTFYFTNCTGKETGKDFDFIWPTDFNVDLAASIIWVYNGQRSETKEGTRYDLLETMHCAYRPRDNINFVRPTCGGCTEVKHRTKGGNKPNPQ